MALLVFLSAAARTRIVAAHFRLVAPHRVHRGIVAADARRSRRARGKTCRTRGSQRRAAARGADAKAPPGSAFGSFSMHRRRGAARRTLRRIIADDGELADPQPVDHVLVDAPLHVLKQLEALFLVLDQRIFLAVAAKADAFLQMVEAVEMVLPLTVDRLEHHEALDLAHRLCADELFPSRRIS